MCSNLSFLSFTQIQRSNSNYTGSSSLISLRSSLLSAKTVYPPPTPPTILRRHSLPLTHLHTASPRQRRALPCTSPVSPLPLVLADATLRKSHEPPIMLAVDGLYLVGLRVHEKRMPQSQCKHRLTFTANLREFRARYPTATK